MQIRQEKYSTTPLSLTEWLFIFLLYITIIAYHGYRFGDEDMTETLSYALYLNDHSLYPNDVYIQAVGKSLLNERFPFTMTLYLFVDHLDWACFILHFISSILLIAGLWKVGKIFLRHPLFQLAFILTSLILSYHINLGGNEIWYNYYVPSQLAKSIGIWAFIFWLEHKRTSGYLLAALSTFAQPVVGAQLALLFLLTDLIPWTKKNGKLLRAPLLYAVTAGVWVAAVFISNLVTDQTITSAEFYNIMEARLAHHFFPSYYPLRSWIILVPLMSGGAFLWKRLDLRIYRFFLWAFLGMLIYLIGIEWLQISSLLSIQWFKITVWLKPLSILAFLWLIEQYFPPIPAVSTLISALLLLVLSVIQISGTYRLFKDRPYHFPTTNYFTEEMDMGRKMLESLPDDACILIPPQVTGIRYFSRRSLYT
ncbi:MAG: hypothetical protein KDC53_21715, partial [Saprospiraceae bacterium]|nr:hypothetical protein [Saprospiraceae bacterium]